MVRENRTAAAACRAVGYESTSQFSREFKRLFGLTPLEEASRMREQLLRASRTSGIGVRVFSLAGMERRHDFVHSRLESRD